MEEPDLSRYAGEPLHINGEPVIPPIASPEDTATHLRVSADIELGEYFDELAIDTEQTLQRLRSEGLAEEAIARLSIKFSNNSETMDITNKQVSGYYFSDTDEIILYPRSSIELFRNITADNLPKMDIWYPDALEIHPLTGQLFSIMTSQTLWHEIRHAKQKNDRGDTPYKPSDAYDEANKKYRKFRIILSLGWLSSAVSNGLLLYGGNAQLGAISATIEGATIIAVQLAAQKQYKRSIARAYETDSAEIDAVNGGSEAPHNAVTVVPSRAYRQVTAPPELLSPRNHISIAAQFM